MHGENKNVAYLTVFYHNQLQNDEERCPGGIFVTHFLI